jgi:alcohol dehydrogenase
MISLQLPKNILFGNGIRKKLADILEEYGKTVFVLTGEKSLKQFNYRKDFENLLKKKSVIFQKCECEEPTVHSINNLIKTAEQFSPDLIIGIGGGTVLDSAKAVSGLIYQESDTADYLEGVGSGLKITQKGLPWIAIPTTSGTGAEATKNSVIKTSPKDGFKKSIRSHFLIADYVIVDPELTLNLPLLQTGLSGMDALSQLLESYFSKKSNIFTNSIIKDALPGMIDALKILPSNLKDIEAREKAAYGSFISGIALANSGLGAVHGFASGLGGMYSIPHGIICASFLLPVIETNMPVIKTKMENLLKLCCYDSMEAFKNEILGILNKFGINGKIKQYGIKETDFEKIVRYSTGSSMSGNPLDLTNEEKKNILKRVLI